MTCQALSPSFTSIAANIQKVGEQARSAAFNAKGLGYFSPGRHFQSVESDYSAARDLTKATTRIELSIKSGLDGSPIGAAAASLLAADDDALRAIYRYAAVAVTFERAVNTKNIATVTQLSYASLTIAPITAMKGLVGVVGTAATQGTVDNATISADQARHLMEDAGDGIATIEQKLVRPTEVFNLACPS
ncbi:MAG: hypothetical protein NVSMB64_27020 [Candidatus Velthaea sp.]